MTVKVKICGITNLDDARAALDAGADALGFNFYEKSPRYISTLAARSIKEHVAPNFVAVGVFVNATTEVIVRTVETAALDTIQLHGDESIAYVNELRNRVDCDLIKAFRVTGSFNPQTVLDYDVDGILLDGFSEKARGGTGESFDWDIAESVSTLTDRLWLAGGLTPGNVRAAISQVHPFFVDACSSLESVPGMKDVAKVQRFIEEAKRA